MRREACRGTESGLEEEGEGEAPPGLGEEEPPAGKILRAGAWERRLSAAASILWREGQRSSLWREGLSSRMEAVRNQRKAKASTKPPASPRCRSRLHKQRAAHQANWQLQTPPQRMHVTRRPSDLGIISTRLHTSPHHQSRHTQ
jgi:hypothetical protein